MTEVRIEANEPYEIYYYNAKYTLKLFCIFSFTFGFMSLMLFLNRDNLKVSLIGMYIFLLLVTFLCTAGVGHISSFRYVKNIKKETLLEPKTIEGNFYIADESAYFHTTRHSGGYLYSNYMSEITFKSSDNSEIKLFSNTDTIKACINMVYEKSYLSTNLISDEKALRPFIFKKIVYGACSKIIFECVFEYDETLIKN